MKPVLNSLSRFFIDRTVSIHAPYGVIEKFFVRILRGFSSSFFFEVLQDFVFLVFLFTFRHKYTYPFWYFYRINHRKGRVSAISATARKLGVIIWNRVVKNVPYHNPKEYLYLDQKRKLAVLKRMQKQVENYNFSVKEFYFATY